MNQCILYDNIIYIDGLSKQIQEKAVKIKKVQLEKLDDQKLVQQKVHEYEKICDIGTCYHSITNQI